MSSKKFGFMFDGYVTVGGTTTRINLVDDSLQKGCDRFVLEGMKLAPEATKRFAREKLAALVEGQKKIEARTDLGSAEALSKRVGLTIAPAEMVG